MRARILLFWIFTGTAETLLLQPSFNVSTLQNASMEEADWGHLTWPTAVEQEQNWVGETQVDVTQTEDEETDIPQNIETDLERDYNSSESEHSQETWSVLGQKLSNGSKAVLENFDFSATSTDHQILGQSNTTSTDSASFQHFQPTVGPLMFTGILEESAALLVPEESHLPVINVSIPLMNETSMNANVSEAQIEKDNPEETTEASTVMGARADPTAVSLPNNFRQEPQPEIQRKNIKDSQAAKTKNKHQGKERKKKALKKGKLVKKSKQESDGVTTAPYFPYFKDHYCPPECTCYGRVVQCSDKDLDNIPYGIPYNSRYVLLMNNRIDSIQLDLLSQYLSMEFLVLSNNLLTDSSLEGAFEGIQALKRLYLERNLLQSIPAALPATLEELRLDGNKVIVMSDTAWSCCPNLLILTLSNNSLGSGSSTIPAGVLSPLVSLRTLSLSHNKLTSVPLHLPLSLQELYLRGNLIHRFQGGVFQGKAELLVLDLSANKLTNKGLGKAALINATRLESLNLEGNFLKHVPRHLPRSLKTLNLEGNSISSVSKAAFLSLTHLEHLGLARNKISKVAPGAFWVLPLLHQLDMSYNTLRQVPRQLPTWLVSITLTHNKIRTIPRDAFCWARHDKTPSSQLVRVQLENNLVDLGSLDNQALNCLRGFQVVHFY